jgi:hypothetical protein
MRICPELFTRCDLKIAAMRALDAGSTICEIAQAQMSPHLLDRRNGRVGRQGDLAFPGIERRAGLYPRRMPRQAAPVEVEIRDQMQKELWNRRRTAPENHGGTPATRLRFEPQARAADDARGQSALRPPASLRQVTPDSRHNLAVYPNPAGG